MQLSVGEKVQGPEPGSERSRDGWLQEETDKREERGRGTANAARTVGSNTHKDGEQAEKKKKKKSLAAAQPSAERRTGSSKLDTPEKRGASVSFPSIQDRANVKSVAAHQSSSDAKITRPDRGAVRVRKNTEANMSSPERDAPEGA